MSTVTILCTFFDFRIPCWQPRLVGGQQGNEGAGPTAAGGGAGTLPIQGRTARRRQALAGALPLL